jgi:voltage-gated potassium channel
VAADGASCDSWSVVPFPMSPEPVPLESSMRFWSSRPYTWLLLALVALSLSHTLLPHITGSYLPFHILLTVVYIVAFFAVCRTRLSFWSGLFLIVPAIIGTWVRYATIRSPDFVLNAGFHLFAALAFAYLACVIVRGSYQQVAITADGLLGAFCAYFLVAIIFGHLYCLCETLAPGSFAGGKAFNEEMLKDERRQFLLTYFSFITLTTVGYGDITPCSDATRTFATLEALTGQFYLVILISEFVRRRGSADDGPLPARELNDSAPGS